MNQEPFAPRPRPDGAPRGAAAPRKGFAYTLARVLVFLVFLGVFLAIDVVVWRYETAARDEYNRAPDHLATWRIVCERWPWSYVACRARFGIENLGGLYESDTDPPAAQIARALCRSAVAPALLAVGLTDASTAVAAAEFDPLRTAYTALAASLFATVVALYLAVGVWRTGPPPWSWRLTLLGLALFVAGYAWWRAIASPAARLAPAFAWAWVGEVEMIAALALALAAFCLVFYRARPPRRIVRE